MSTESERTLPVWIPPLLDVLVVVVFVLIGLRSHGEDESVAGFLRVWWPFAAALGLSAVCAGSWWHPLVWKRAVVAWLGTVVLGMVMRIGIEGRHFKPGFAIVTTVFLGAGMLGWRLVAVRLVDRRARSV